MGKYQIQKICIKTTEFISANSATILSGLGAIGVISTAVLSSKAKTKAEMLLAEKEEYKLANYEEPLTRFERMLAVIPAYIPTILMGAGTIACIMGANHINKQQQAMLTSAYAYLNCSYKEYKEKVKTLFGDDKEKMVREAIAKDKADSVKLLSKEKEEDMLSIYDEWGGRYFTISKQKFNEALYEINRMYNFTGSMTLNNFYEFFDLDPIPGGDLLGWSALKDFECCGISWIDVKLEKMQMIDDYEAFVMTYNVDPSDDYACWVTNEWY